MNCTKDALRVKRVIEETRRFKKTQEDKKIFKNYKKIKGWVVNSEA